jgi:hypothetical protein
MAQDSLSVISLPRLARLASGVFLVQANQQVDQLTPDGLDPSRAGSSDRLISQSAYQLAQSSSAPSTIRKT